MGCRGARLDTLFLTCFRSSPFLTSSILLDSVSLLRSVSGSVRGRDTGEKETETGVEEREESGSCALRMLAA